jgi:hypothetical protein
MKPIKAKFTPDLIIGLENIMKDFANWGPFTTEQKVAKSILVEVADKIHLRYRKITKTTDLFNSKKTVSIELKFHELVHLLLFIKVRMDNIDKKSKEHNDFLKFNNEYEKLTV